MSAVEWAAVSAIAATISIALAIATTVGVFSQARAAHKTNAADLFISFSARYNSPEMAAALRALAALYRESPNDFASKWINAKRSGDAEALKLNDYRRLVSRLYFDVARLYHAKLISTSFARELLRNNGLNVFYKVCEPMNDEDHPQRIKLYSRILVGLQKKYGSGQIHGDSRNYDKG